MSRQYKNSPISEAVCEFQFEQNSPWDLTVPGLIYERVRTSFPKRGQVARVILGILADEGEIGQQVGAVPLMRFSSEDEKKIIQVGTHLLSVNYLRPYSSWHEFLSLIQVGFSVYREVASPKSIHRIGLRYINTIQITGQSIELEDYFEFRPYVGPNLPHTIGPFMVSTQLPFESSRDALNLRLASLAGASSNTINIVLDLDYFLAQSGEVTLDEAFTWIETAHSHVEEIFEACITDKLRQTFEEQVSL